MVNRECVGDLRGEKRTHDKEHRLLGGEERKRAPDHREQSASSELRLDAVTLAAATEALEGLTGLAVCGQRHEEGSDISYLAARSNLDETVYLAMVVAKPYGDEGVELELLCRASQGEAAQELLEELQSALRNRLLEAGGRLA